ncbi:MAG: hypothetical protein QM726_15235 [Chitinophagaceae bacterium]
MTQEIFNKWLDKIITKERPVSGIIAYYFGIIETASGYETYLIGSKEFDEDDEDWACNVDFEPADKYLNIGQATTEWQTILEQAKMLIKNYLLTENCKNSFLGQAKAIATGFDGGDLHLIK